MTAATRVGSTSSSAGTASATTSGTMSLSALGVQVGDLVIVQCVVERNSSTPALAIAGGVSSFTTLLSVTTGTNLQTIVGYFFAQSGDLSATVAGTVAAARRIVAAVEVWRGAGVPTLVSNAAVGNGGATTTIIHPSVTPGSNDNVVMLAFGGASTTSAFNTRSFTAAAGFNKRVDAGATNTSSIDPYVGFSDEALTGGSGAATGTFTQTASNGNFEYIATTILVPPGSSSFTDVATLAGSGSLAASVVPAMAGAAALSGAGGLSAIVAPSIPGPAMFGGSGALSATGVPAMVATAAFAAAGTLTATAAAGMVVVPAFTGSGALTATGGNNAAAVAALSGSGSLTGAGTPKAIAVPALSGGGSLSAAVAPGSSAAPLFASVGVLSVSVAVLVAALLSGAGVLTAAAPGRVGSDAVVRGRVGQSRLRGELGSSRLSGQVGQARLRGSA